MSLENDESGNSSILKDMKKNITDLSYQTLDTFNKQPLWRRLIVIIAGIVFGLLGVLLVIYRETAFNKIVEYSDKWYNFPFTPFILGGLIFLTSFPPLIGFSFLSAAVGVIFGISIEGWVVIFLGSLLGSVGAFLLFRIILKKKAKLLIESNDRLLAFSSVLNDNRSYLILALIRICPFPYSFTNGALAGIPGVSLSHFALGSIISSPKLFLYLFVGQKIKNMGQTHDPYERLIDFLSIILTVIILAVTGWVLFSRTSKRLREIENQRMVENERYSDEFDRELDNEFELDDGLDNGNETDDARTV